jgi:GT2 family glycosyltransferase
MGIPLTIDLVLATMGRTEELSRFLRSLDGQSYRTFRVIVVDQNGDDRLVPILHDFEDTFATLHLRSEPGLSRARNVALGHLSANLTAFPDDDCWYGPGVLERVATFFAQHPDRDGLAGLPVDETGRTSAGRPDTRPGAVTTFNLWRRVASFTLFLRRGVTEAVGPFDECLGVGSGTPWGGGEDLDYVARALRAGCSIHYDPTLVVHHPRKREHESTPDARQGYDYGAGYGRVLRKNELPLWFAFYSCARSFGGAALSLMRGHVHHARFFWSVGRGRVRGWRSTSSAF